MKNLTNFVVPSKRSQQGASLIEVLVSILVLAIGMLGIAAILLVSLRNSQGAMEHSQAVIQSHAMLDVMRANKPQAIIGGYNLTSWTCDPPTADSRIGTELADFINALDQEVSPSACGRIVCGSLNCTVSVRWNDERGTGGEEEKIYILSTRI